jgi:hypothetical protein
MSRTGRFVGVLLLIVATPAAAGSPWTREQGRGFVQLAGYSIGPYETLFRSSGDDFRTGREIRDDTVELYAEHGLTSRWTLVGTLPWKRIEAGDPVADPTLSPATVAAGSRSTPGNAELGVRRKLVDGGFVLSGQLDLELPTGSFDEATGLS